MNFAYIVQQVDAALGLALRRPGALKNFDFSREGFKRSFLAALICLPGYLALQTSAGQDVSLFGEALGYAAVWAVLPLIALLVTRQLNVPGRFVPVVVATNWSAVVWTSGYVAAIVLARGLPTPFGPLLVLAAIAGVLWFEWYVIRAALETTGPVAAGVVALDLVASVAVETAFSPAV